MVKEYLRANDKVLEYGEDLDVVKFIRTKRATLNMASKLDFSLLMELFHKFKASIRILRPHEISDNLAKLICLF